MYHSIRFIPSNQPINANNLGGYDAYEDWHLVPTSRPVVNPPKLKSKIIEIAGGDGSIDLSESLTKYPLYDNREGSWEFIVLNDTWAGWDLAYRTIANALHGKMFKVILEDEPQYYYEGRITINEWRSNNDGTWSNIVLDYNLKPYKLEISDTLEDWLWDPFNFETGIIPASVYKDIRVTTTSSWTKRTLDHISYKPIVPYFVVNATNGMDIGMNNPELDIDGGNTPGLTAHFNNGKSQNPRFVLSNVSGNNIVTLFFKGNGKVSIQFRNGVL